MRLARLGSSDQHSYTHQGSLAYVGSDKAIGDFPTFKTGNFAAAGMATYIVWRSAYLSKLFSLRNVRGTAIETCADACSACSSGPTGSRFVDRPHGR